MEPGSPDCLPGPSSISQGLFENSLQTAVRVSTTAIFFLEERTTCELTLAKGRCRYFFFFVFSFLKDQEAEKCVYICLVQERQSEPALQIFGILIQPIKAELLSDSTSEGPECVLFNNQQTCKALAEVHPPSPGRAEGFT